MPKDNMVENGLPEREVNISALFSEPENTIDVIVLGDSESFTAVSPLRLWDSHGITTFVCGQPGQKVVEAYYCLKQIFEKQSPKLVIMETNMFFRYENFETELDEGIHELLGHYIPFYRYHDNWKKLTWNDFIPKFRLSRRDPQRGFVVKEGVVPYTGGAYMHETEDVEKVSALTGFYMKQMERLCEKNGAKILLLSVPSPVNWSYERHNGMTEFAEAEEFSYLDLNLYTDQLQIDWERDTMDAGDHLNIYGAVKINRYLGTYLSENYNLENHTGKAGYEFWESDSEAYLDKSLGSGNGGE